MIALFGVFGVGGCARGVMPLVRSSMRLSEARAVFVDRVSSDPVNGHEVMSEAAFLAHPGERRFVVGIAESGLRRRITAVAEAAGAIPFEVRAASAEVLDDVDLGPGAILCSHATITSNVRIGAGFHLNLHAYVEHDCVIGDFVTFGPKAACNGNVVVGDEVYIGAGAVLRQGKPDKPLRIGAGAIVGMGAVVTKDVPPGITVVGNPARPFIKP